MVIIKSSLRSITYFLYKNWLSTIVEKQSQIRKNSRVLVQMNSGMGDSVLALPLIHELKRTGYDVYALTNQNTNTLGELCPDIQKSYILEYKISSFFKILRDVYSLHKLRFRYYVGVLPSNRIRDFFLPILLKIPIRVRHQTPHKEKYRNYDFLFSKTIDIDCHKNNVESNLMLFSLLNDRYEPNERKFNLALCDRFMARVKRKLEKLGYRQEKFVVGIHPGCKETWSFKRWPAKNFAELINVMTRQSDLQVILFGGPDEKNLTGFIMQNVKIKPLNLIGELSLKETVCAISICGMFISNDSGLMHIATVFGIPVIGLFGGRSNEVLIGPYGSQHVVIKDNDINQITVEEVYRAASSLLTRRINGQRIVPLA